MHPNWACNLRDQCTAAGVPFFFKQWGEWIALDQDKVKRFPRGRPGEYPDDKYISWDGTTTPVHAPALSAYLVRKVGKARAGRLLDDAIWDQIPAAAAGVGAC